MRYWKRWNFYDLTTKVLFAFYSNIEATAQIPRKKHMPKQIEKENRKHFVIGSWISAIDKHLSGKKW